MTTTDPELWAIAKSINASLNGPTWPASKPMSEAPNEGYILVRDDSGFFDVVEYSWSDSDGVRVFYNGDVGLRETDLVEWWDLPK